MCYCWYEQLGTNDEPASGDVFSQINQHLKPVPKQSCQKYPVGKLHKDLSMCLPGSAGKPFLVLGAVCRALVVEGARSCVGDQWKVKGRKWWMRMRIAEGAPGLYGDWTLMWLHCWGLHLESRTSHTPCDHMTMTTSFRECDCDLPPCDSSEGGRGSDISSVVGAFVCLPSLPSSDDCLPALFPSSLRLIPLSVALSTSQISSALTWTQTYQLIPQDEMQKFNFLANRRAPLHPFLPPVVTLHKYFDASLSVCFHNCCCLSPQL